MPAVTPGDLMRCTNCVTPLQVNRLMKVERDTDVMSRMNADINAGMNMIQAIGGVREAVDTGEGGYSGLGKSSWLELQQLAASGKYYMLTVSYAVRELLHVVKEIEETLYNIKTPAAQLFRLFHAGWEQTVWSIVVVPMSEKPKVERLLAARGVRPVAGIPMMYIDGKPEPIYFPTGDYPALYNLELASQRATPPPKKPDEDIFNMPTHQRLMAYLRKYEAKFPGIWKRIEEMRQKKSILSYQWPTSTYVPVRAVYDLLGAYGDDDLTMKLQEVGVIAGLGNWRMSRGIYRFDATVYEAVWETKLKGRLPLEAFDHMPEWCVYIETPNAGMFTIKIAGFFAMLDKSGKGGQPCLRILFDSNDGLLSFPLYLKEESLTRSLVDSLEFTRDAIKGTELNHLVERYHHIESLAAGGAEGMSAFVSLVLYLCTVDSDVQHSHGKLLRPRNPSPQRGKHGQRRILPAELSIWNVGYRIGGAIRSAKEARPAPSERSSTGRRQAPHLRRAHYHWWYTGSRKLAKAERGIIGKWLPPIPVNVNKADDLVPTIRKVKE